MCGLVAIVNLDGRPVDRGTLGRMVETVRHRGPDSEGLWTDGAVGLGHRRLAVFDPSPAGAQPMDSFDGRWCVIFNGALYDYQERRQDLERRGVAFRGGSDTEVLANSLAVFGPDCLGWFNGMFSVVAWDRAEQTLHLARDRFGIKPLYHWSDGKVFLAASEIKALLAHPAVGADLNLCALREYFTFQNLFRHHTLFAGVHSLPPATHAVLAGGVLHKRVWWDFDFSNPDEAMSFDDAVTETRRLIVQAVERQLVADARVGCYLSGGMDSSSIVSAATRKIPRLITFTGGFDLSSATGVEMNFDERREAEALAASLQTEHYERVFAAADIACSVPSLVYHLEDIRLGMSYPNYYMAQLASKFVKVVLSGTGGDELFGGYPWRYYRVFRSTNQGDFLKSYFESWQRLVPVTEQADFFQKGVLDATATDATPFEIFAGIFQNNDRLRYETVEDHIGNSLYFEAKTFLQGLLVVQDRVSAAHGVEERVPFLDNDLVDFAMKVPVRHKLGNLTEMRHLDENEYQKQRKAHALFGDGKTVLREAMRGLLPPEVVRRPKQGFSSPEGSWYRTEASAYVQRMLLENSRPAYCGFIAPAYVRRVVEEHVSGKVNHRLLIWSLLCFEHWCQIFLGGSKA